MTSNLLFATIFYGINKTSTEIAVLRYSKDHTRFSKPGDLGSIVLNKTDKVIRVLVSGGGLWIVLMCYISPHTLISICSSLPNILASNFTWSSLDPVNVKVKVRN